MLVQDLAAEAWASPSIKLWMILLLTTRSFLPSQGLVGLQGTAQHLGFDLVKWKIKKDESETFWDENFWKFLFEKISHNAYVHLEILNPNM